MVQVTLLDTMELATFCVRTFSLHKVNLLAVLRLRSPPDPRFRCSRLTRAHCSPERVAPGRDVHVDKQRSGDFSEPSHLFKLGQPPRVRRRDSIAAVSEALSYSMRLI